MPNRLRHWWRQWWALASWEKRMLLLVAGRLLRIDSLLRRRTLAAVLADIDAIRLRPRPLPVSMSADDFTRRCAQLINIAAHHSFHVATCLPRSVVLYQLLQEHGLPAQLRLGVQQPTGERLQAHAWVECAGQIFGDAAGYQAFPALGEPGNA